MKRTTHPAMLALLLALGSGCDGTLGERADASRSDSGDARDADPLNDASVPVDVDAGPLELPDAFIAVEDAHVDLDLATVVSHTLPASLACTATTTASVTMRNVGDTTWSAAARYGLLALNPEDVLLTGGDTIAIGSDVAPGGEVTFDLTLSAPGAGTYRTEWRMVRAGVHAFGDVATSDVSVGCDGSFRAFPAVIDGTFGMPEHEQRIASRNTALLRTGHVITGDDAIDNAVLGGGSPDGGIWLSGRFHFEIDATGQNTAASWISVFSDEHFPVTGGVYANGELHMGSPAGVDISGLLKNGVVTGYVAEGGNTVTRDDSLWVRLSPADQNYLRGIWHGADLEYVHGLMTGTGTLD